MNVPTPRRHAFTLVELLIVITIIGILVVALTPRLLGSQASARDASRQAAIQQIATALEFYADANNGTYPDAQNGVCVTDIVPLTQFLTVVPTDPLEGNSHRGDTGPCGVEGGYEYYSLNPEGTSYILLAELENTRKEGTGIYQSNIFTANEWDEAQDVLTGEVLCDADAANCTDQTGAVYVSGR